MPPGAGGARGIEIPFPRRTATLRSEEPEVARLARLAARS